MKEIAVSESDYREDSPVKKQYKFHISEGDIYEDLTDRSSDEEEVIEVEISAGEIDDFVQELKQIEGLEPEIICGDDELIDDQIEEPLPIPSDTFDSFGNYEPFQNTPDESKDDLLDNNDNEGFGNDDDFFNDDYNSGALIPITQIKYEAAPLSSQRGQKKEATLKLHKLDSFLIDKFLKASKKFLRTRYLTQLTFIQESQENGNNLTEPIDMGDGTFKCHKCLKILSSKKVVKRHIREFHERSNLAQCDQCDYVGASLGALNYHVQSIHLKMFRYECPECNEMKSQKKTYVIKHLVEEHGHTQEDAETMVQSKLRLKNRAKGENHECPRCTYKTPQKYGLKRHLAQRHGVEMEVDPSQVCPFCHEEFLSPASKIRHPCPVKLRAHESLKDIEADANNQFACPTCPEGKGNGSI